MALKEKTLNSIYGLLAVFVGLPSFLGLYSLLTGLGPSLTITADESEPVFSLNCTPIQVPVDETGHCALVISGQRIPAVSQVEFSSSNSDVLAVGIDNAQNPTQATGRYRGGSPGQAQVLANITYLVKFGSDFIETTTQASSPITVTPSVTGKTPSPTPSSSPASSQPAGAASQPNPDDNNLQIKIETPKVNLLGSRRGKLWYNGPPIKVQYLNSGSVVLPPPNPTSVGLEPSDYPIVLTASFQKNGSSRLTQNKDKRYALSPTNLVLSSPDEGDAIFEVKCEQKIVLWVPIECPNTGPSSTTRTSSSPTPSSETDPTHDQDGHHHNPGSGDQAKTGDNNHNDAEVHSDFTASASPIDLTFKAQLRAGNLILTPSTGTVTYQFTPALTQLPGNGTLTGQVTGIINCSGLAYSIVSFSSLKPSPPFLQAAVEVRINSSQNTQLQNCLNRNQPVTINFTTGFVGTNAYDHRWTLTITK